MDAVEDIKQRLNIEDVISEYVELKRAGRNFKGLSPFSNERSPSFMVSPEKQIWHDFSSGKGGNMFSFVMEMEGLDFKGALELLARKAGVDLEQYRSSGSSSRGKEKERLYEALELAATFYQKQLNGNHEALGYVRTKREFTKETQLEWRLGYSPGSGNALVSFLQSKGFTEKEIKGAGLSAQRYRGLGDMFRGRIMIPLCDPQGRVIGFTARLLTNDPDAPKYINTPQTLLYDKSHHVFGLHLAKDAIRKSKFVVVAEGNLDVISSHQAGVCQVVATAGTAMTEFHLKALSRFTDDIRLSFDADNAGLNATERAIPIASKVNVSLSIVTIPTGKDPDELVKHDVEIWKSVIAKPQYAIDWLIDRYRKQLDIDSAQGKKQFSNIVLKVVNTLQDKVEQEHYMHVLTKIIGVSQEALRSKLTDSKTPVKRKAVHVQRQDYSRAHLIRLERQNLLLGILLKFPSWSSMLEPLGHRIFPEPEAQKLYLFIKNYENAQSDTNKAQLGDLEDYAKRATALYDEKQYSQFDKNELRKVAEGLMAPLVVEYVEHQIALKNDLYFKMPETIEDSSQESDEQKKLKAEINYLNALRKKYKK